MSTKNARLKTIHASEYQVAVSNSGDPGTWVRQSPNHPNTEAGMEMANAAAQKLSHTNRFVRVAKVEHKITPKKVIENLRVLSKQQIASLLAAGKTALAGIPGVMVNEGMLMFMSSLTFSETRVTVSFVANAVLGPLPRISSRFADEDEKRRVISAKAEWNNRAIELTKTTLDKCAALLTTAGIKFVRRAQEIELKA